MDDFLSQLYKRMDAMEGGDPTDMSVCLRPFNQSKESTSSVQPAFTQAPLDPIPQVDYSSLISAKHKAKVMDYIKKGVDEGARLYVSGMGYTTDAVRFALSLPTTARS